MLDKFIICVCDNDLRPLIINNNGITNEALQSAWGTIYNEYLDALKDKEQSYIVQLKKEIYLLGFKIEHINLCFTYLSIQFNIEVLAELKKLIAITGQFNPEDPAQYLKDLQIAINQSKQLVVELKTKESELKSMIPEDSGKIDRNYFNEVLIQLSKHMRFPIVKQTTSVSEFASMMADMNLTHDYLKKQADAKR